MMILKLEIVAKLSTMNEKLLTCYKNIKNYSLYLIFKLFTVNVTV